MENFTVFQDMPEKFVGGDIARIPRKNKQTR
jgi:hypothetical protein